MSFKMTPRSLSAYVVFSELRDEIQKSIRHADVSRRYARLRAARLNQLAVSFIFVSTLASVVGTLASLQGKMIVGIAALLLSIACVSAPGLLKLSARRSAHLVAHTRALDAGAAWARLTTDGYAPATLQRNLLEARRATRLLAAVSPQTRDIELWTVAERSFERALP